MDWHGALLRIRDNPYGVAIERFGEATGLLVHAIPDPHYNRVIGLGEAAVGQVGEIARFYRERMVPFRFDINPGSAGSGCLAALTKAGFQPVGGQSNLIAGPHIRLGQWSNEPLVREVQADELDSFAPLYARAYYDGVKTPKMILDLRAESVKARFSQPQWRFYVALVDGVPAGGAEIHLSDGVASLTGAATIGGFRGRGCHRALLLHRLEQTALLGCDLVVSRCAVGSVSQRNMERCGLSVAYTKVIWQQPADASFYEISSSERKRRGKWVLAG